MARLLQNGCIWILTPESVGAGSFACLLQRAIPKTEDDMIYSAGYTLAMLLFSATLFCPAQERVGLTAHLASGTEEDAVEFEGRLEEGQTYRAVLVCDKDGRWQPLIPIKVPYHHAALIEWLNLKDFPELKEADAQDCQRRIVFKVVSKETVKVNGQRRWNTTYRCRIVRVE